MIIIFCSFPAFGAGLRAGRPLFAYLSRAYWLSSCACCNGSNYRGRSATFVLFCFVVRRVRSFRAGRSDVDIVRNHVRFRRLCIIDDPVYSGDGSLPVGHHCMGGGGINGMSLHRLPELNCPTSDRLHPREIAHCRSNQWRRSIQRASVWTSIIIFSLIIVIILFYGNNRPVEYILRKNNFNFKFICNYILILNFIFI